MATAQQLAFSLFIIIACVPHIAQNNRMHTRTNSQIQAQPTHRLAFSLTPRRYLGLNSFLNLLNRWALGLYGLRFPLIMTSCHMIFGSTALAPMMLMRDDHARKVVEHEVHVLGRHPCADDLSYVKLDLGPAVRLGRRRESDAVRALTQNLVVVASGSVMVREPSQPRAWMKAPPRARVRLREP